MTRKRLRITRNNRPKRHITIVVFIYVLNLPRNICNHVVGEHHTESHRMLAGLMIGGFGVFISKQAAHSAIELVHYAGDYIGYLIHGIGCVPFIERLTRGNK